MLRRAAVRAAGAPSPRNSQPWHFVLLPAALEIHADWTRQLPSADPRGRQLLLACGGAVFDARVAVAAAGHYPVVARFPDSARPDLVARISLAPEPDADARPVRPPVADLEPLLDRRRSDPRGFTDDDPPAEVLASAVDAAAAEGTELARVPRPGQCLLAAAGPQDDPLGWLRGGEAVERVRLVLARHGYATRSLRGPVEDPARRERLRRRLGGGLEPLLVLRVGRAPAGHPPRRRRLVDMLTEPG